MENLV